MRSFKSTIALMLIFSLSLATASPLFEDTDILDDVDDGEDGEGRIFFSSNGGISFTNSTVNLASLLAAALLGLFLALTLGSSFLGGSAGAGGYGYGGNQQHGYGYNSNNFYQRSDKNVYEADLASQMYQLATAFKKYEVNDIECQLFVACEASQVRREAVETGNVLAQIAHGVKPIMVNIGKHGRKTIEEKDAYVAKLVDAYMYGDEVVKSGGLNKDACEVFRHKCYQNSKKTA